MTTLMAILGYGAATIVLLFVGFIVGIKTTAGLLVKQRKFKVGSQEYRVWPMVPGEMDNEEREKASKVVIDTIASGDADAVIARAIKRNYQRTGGAGIVIGGGE